MKFTSRDLTIIELALNSYIAELKDRIESFEEAAKDGEESYIESLESAKERLEYTVSLLKEVEEM